MTGLITNLVSKCVSFSNSLSEIKHKGIKLIKLTYELNLRISSN